MFLEAIPKSISPAVPGWWARFRNDDCGEWWSPVAAWAICDVFYSGDSEVYSEILPVLTGDMGMTHHITAQRDIANACICLTQNSFFQMNRERLHGIRLTAQRNR